MIKALSYFAVLTYAAKIDQRPTKQYTPLNFYMEFVRDGVPETERYVTGSITGAEDKCDVYPYCAVKLANGQECRVRHAEYYATEKPPKLVSEFKCGDLNFSFNCGDWTTDRPGGCEAFSTGKGYRKATYGSLSPKPCEADFPKDHCALLKKLGISLECYKEKGLACYVPPPSKPSVPPTPQPCTVRYLYLIF